jgi:hypothetical protein
MAATDRLKELHARASDGPWVADRKINIGRKQLLGAFIDCGPDMDGGWIVMTDRDRGAEADAAFIVAAHDLWPALVKCVEAIISKPRGDLTSDEEAALAELEAKLNG